MVLHAAAPHWHLDPRDLEPEGAAVDDGYLAAPEQHELCGFDDFVDEDPCGV
jgi:hypothetical protein